MSLRSQQEARDEAYADDDGKDHRASFYQSPAAIAHNALMNEWKREREAAAATVVKASMFMQGAA